MTMDRLPYTYSLYGYGPDSKWGRTDAGQRLVTGEGNNHWDWRLQSNRQDVGIPEPEQPAPGQPEFGEGHTRHIASQVTSYLVAPRALFYAGQQDLSNLQRNMNAMRIRSANSADGGRGSFFMSAYGGSYKYHSNLDLNHYGYDADINYASMQLGGNFYGLENKNGAVHFGLAGSYGDLSFKPYSVRDVHKTDMDVWNVAPYMAWQHHSGGYVDVVVAYGGFDGAVSTDLRGRTAKLKGHSYAASLGAGLPVALPLGDLVFEPQAQIIYQRFKFNRQHDVDEFPVELGNPDQWLVRFGGQLQKRFVNTERGLDIAVYGGLNLLHVFKDEHDIWLGDSFKTGSGGSQLETSLGLDASIFGATRLYGDISWNERVGSAGSSGFSLSGGLKGRF